MSKADRSIKEKIKYNRTITPQSEEENTSILPKIENKKPLANITTESYNFVSSVKKSGTSRDSIPGIISKELVGSLTPQERALVEELAKKIEEQRKEIEQRNHTLMAIQRNFEGLSTMLKKEKELGAENKKRIIAVTEDNNKLAEENRVLTKRVDDMIERLKKYEHELDSSAKDKRKINQSIEEQEALKSKIQELQSILERKKKEISDLEAKNKSLSVQIDKLKNTITNMEGERQQSALKLKEAKAELETSNKENDKLQKVILEYKLKVGDFDKLKEDNASLLAKKNDADKENKELINEISVLRHEITTLKNHNKKLEDGVQTQNMQLRFGNQKEESLAQEVKELKKLLEARDAEVFEFNLKVGELQATLQGEVQHRLKYKDLVERYDALTKDGSEVRLIKKTDVEKINADLEQLRAKTGDYDELKKKVERLTSELQKKNEMIDRYVSEKQFESGNASKLNERIRVLEEENKRLLTHNQKLISALDFKNENEKVKDGQLNSEIESLRQKLEANLSSLGDINSKHKTLQSEKDSLTKQVDTMKRELDIKNREMDSMKNKIDKLESERDSRNKEIDFLRKKIDNLEAERDSKLKESDSNASQLRKELYALRDQYKNLQETSEKSISSLNKQVDDLKAQNIKKDDEISQLKLSLIQTKTSLDAITQENATSQKALQNLQAQVKDLKGSLEIKENQVDAFKKENSSLTIELEAKTKQVQGLTIDISELQDKVRTLTEKNDGLNTKNQEMAATIKQLLNDLHLARLRQKQSESTIEDLEQKLKQVMNKLTELDELKFKDKLARLEDREKQFNKVVAKMDHAQSSLLISLSCCECMSSLKNPVTFLPCAHNYCEKCVPKNGNCKECGDNQEPEYQYRNKLLEDVITKVSYNQVILESIKPKDD